MDCWIAEDDARQWVAQDPTPDYAYWEWRDMVKVPLVAGQHKG